MAAATSGTNVLTLLDGVDAAAAPPVPDRRQLRASIDRYVTTSGSAVGGLAGGSTSPEALRTAGIPVLAG